MHKFLNIKYENIVILINIRSCSSVSIPICTLIIWNISLLKTSDGFPIAAMKGTIKPKPKPSSIDLTTNKNIKNKKRNLDFASKISLIFFNPLNIFINWFYAWTWFVMLQEFTTFNENRYQ